MRSFFWAMADESRGVAELWMMKENGKIWTLVCDASRARLFESDGPGRDWELVAELEHPESRASARELRESADIGNAGTKHGPPEESSPTARKDLEADRFAHQLSQVLARGFDGQRFAELVVVAPPQFLGMLRKVLPERVSRRVTRTLNAELTQLPVRELAERVQP